jgi:predicted Zn-dependent protease
MTQQELAGIGVGIASVVSPTFQRYSGVAQQALGLMFLKYSRDDETQADQLGVEYATRAGYDPREIPNTYVMLRRVGDASGQRMPAFMSTHPDPGDRETRTRDLATAAAAGKSGLAIRSRDYVRRLDGVVFGEDPRQGWFDGTRFIQPELGFEITFPTGWQTQNTRQAVMAGAKDQSGVMQMTLAEAKDASPEQYVDQLVQAQKLASAQGQRESIGGYPAWVGHAGLLQQDGSVAPIVAGFIRKTNGPMFQILGQTSADEGAIVASIRSFRSSTATRPPLRVKVVTVPKTGPFSTVASAFGPLGIGIDPLSIMNIVEPDEPVAQGTLIKIVPKP